MKYILPEEYPLCFLAILVFEDTANKTANVI
jgi:hypothetical protein